MARYGYSSFFPKIIIYHIFQGALPLFQSVSKYSLSLCVSIAAQNPSCLKTESSLSLANPSSGSRSHIVSSLSILFMTSGSQTKNPPLIQRLSPFGFSKKLLTNQSNIRMESNSLVLMVANEYSKKIKL